MTTLSAVIAGMIHAHATGLRVSLPGRIVSYDPRLQRADVQPLIMDGYEDEDGSRVSEALPIVTDVPVCFPGGGGYRITFPIKAGDTVELRFMSSSIARWKRTGGLVDPADDRRHALPDAIAIPALHDYAHVPTAAPIDALVVHGESIKLGGPAATDRVARQSDLEALRNIIGGVGDSAGANAALSTALEAASWPNCTSKVRTE